MAWTNIGNIRGPGVPAGGSTGQVLTKTSATDYATHWQTPSSGGASAGYIHVQGSPTSTWNITHNLGFYPNLTVVDSSETQVEGTVTYTGLNTMTVTFTAAFSGRGYLS